MNRRLQILILEDNPADAQLVVRELKRQAFDFDWQRVDTEKDYLEKLNPGIDLILSDYEMPQFSGLRALELLNERPSLNIPFIIISGTIGEDLAVAAMQKGATDYLLKDRIARLGPAVRHALRGVDEHAERKRLEAQFLETQKMEVVGHLAGGVAHDFNNVLGVIMGYSDLLVDELRGQQRLSQYVDEIRHATTRAAGLTQQLLIFSRKKQVKAVELNLNEVIQGIEKMLHQLINENVEMTVEYGEEIGQVMADSGYIWQVLMNLVVNARDAMLEGGKLAIRTSNATLDDRFAQAHPVVKAGAYVLLSVTDTGIGMTDEVKERLFEAFFTTKGEGKGTGLGLVTCQTIVRQSGGCIEVLSELGKGTTFNVYFPQIKARGSTETELVPTASVARGGTETVLLVEDDPSLRHLAEGVLKGQGYTVIRAPNGQDALRVARDHRGAPIQLVVTDVVMPRMGGKVMAEWLKITYPDLKVLFTSGYTEEAVAQQGVTEGEFDFLPKPYSPAALARKVRELLDH